MLFMGQSIISTAIFNSKPLNYQRVMGYITNGNQQDWGFKYGTYIPTMSIEGWFVSYNTINHAFYLQMLLSTIITNSNCLIYPNKWHMEMGFKWDLIKQ